MSASLSQEIAAAAAQLVVEDGLEYAQARHKAARKLGGRAVKPGQMPRNEEIEDEVRAYLATFHADRQPQELRALRELAARWMERLAAHRPHLAGATWRGTATRRSALLIDLYCDDPKGTEIDLINQGLDFDAGGNGNGDAGQAAVLTLAARVPGWPEPVTLHLLLHDLDDLRGALKPDARGRTWRGDRAALQRLLGEEAA
ncbi:MAG: hypothetical protein QM750_17175 [Rubrivivax sp.]